MTVSVTSVNSQSLGTDAVKTVNEDHTYNFLTTGAEFGLTDPSDTPANTFQSVIITTLPTRGTLTLGGVPVNAGDEIGLSGSPKLLSAGLVYTPVANTYGSPYATFTF